MSNLAKEKFKELDVEKKHSWIMLFNLIILNNLINSCIVTVVRIFTLHFRYYRCCMIVDQFLLQYFRFISKKNVTPILCCILPIIVGKIILENCYKKIRMKAGKTSKSI